MDWGLPGISGIEAARQIRALPDKKKANTLIVAATAGYDMKHVIEGFREVGVEGIIEKPHTTDPKTTRIIARLHFQKKRIGVDT